MALNKISNLSSQVSTTSGKIPVYKSLPNVDRNVEAITNITTLDEGVTTPVVTNTFYTSKLLNYVEPAVYGGVQKTAFYTELSTNFVAGDRVYILNGFYDSDDYIQKDKYTKFTDGYRVLDVNGCRVVLNLDYTGQIPYVDYNQEDLIFVHNITSQEKFNYVNTLTIGLSYSTSINTSNNKLYSSFSGQNFTSLKSKRADLYGGNIIFVPAGLIFNTISDGIILSTNDVKGLLVGRFFVKSTGGTSWTDISDNFLKNRLRIRNQLINPKLLTGNKKIVIVGEDFTYKNFTFRERCVYKYSTEKSTWIFDKSYKQPIISKMNFRSGLFKGTHQDGIFGSYDKAVNWNNATWNSGFFVNSNWIKGSMNSKSVRGAKNFVAKLSVDTSGNRISLQNADTSNNKGFGYNYTIDSTIKESTITNGNFENSNIGISYSTTSIDNYYNNTATHSVSITGGNFNFCDVDSTSIGKSTINDSIIKNSVLRKSRSINNQIIDSVASGVDYSSEGGLQILGADLYSYYDSSRYNSTVDYTDVRGVLKLFISDIDFLRMEKGDSFYIEKINKEFFLGSLTSDQKILLPIETRYLLDYYMDSEKSSDIISVSLKSKNENRYKYYLKLVSEPFFDTLYSPTIGSAYWDSPTPNGNETFNEPVDWVKINQAYLQYALVFYTVNGQTRMYYYLGDDTTGPGNDGIPIINDPTDTSQGTWWSDVGIYKGDWDRTQDIDPLPGDIYRYIDASAGEYYLRRTSVDVVGSGYRTESFVINGSQDSRSLVLVDSGFNACSIDLDSTLFGFYQTSTSQKIYTSTGLSGIPIDSINEAFVNTYIKPSDFRSGLFIDSRWLSGYNINYFQNVIRKRGIYNLDMSYDAPNTLKVRTENKPFDVRFAKSGYDIKKDDYVWLNGVVYQNGGDTVNLSGRYTVSKNPTYVQVGSDNYIEYNIVSIGLSFSNLSNVSATFSVLGAEDANYVTLSKFSIEKSTIISGLFRRTHFSNSFFSNPDFNNEDRSFNPLNTNILRFINIISSNNKLSFEDGVHYNSHIVDPKFNNGIVHESVWNGGTFSLGIFSSGFWKSGTFLNGKFLNSKSTISESVNYSNDQLYKNWFGGKFELGEFYNSVWLDGIFNNGLFWNSDFYGGIWNNGILGSSQIPMLNTTFGHYAKLVGVGGTCAIWNNGSVDNAIMGGDGVVYWYNGRFNAGEFTSYGSDPTKESIWFNGEFNGSKITNLARWKNGTFNNGKFLSYYGWDKVGPTTSSTIPSDYSWEYGRFQNGEFGSKGLTANSVWYDGQFLDGTFQGRFWNSGYFISGNFYGSGVISPTPSNQSNIGEYDFANSFTDNYYGLWKSGFVIDNIAESNFDGRVSIDIRRFEDPETGNLRQKTVLSNVLWMGGTFSHKFGVLKDSLFLEGNFYNGEFDGGIFNPYVDRDFLGSYSNSNFGERSVWYSGDFMTGSFWASQWKGGRFFNGYMSGANWLDGTWYYGTAENIIWNDGTWKNGNWNGSPYDYSLISPTESYLYIVGTDSSDFATISRFIMNDGREKDLIYKTSFYNESNTNIHVFNIFSASNPITLTADGFTNSKSWTYSPTETYTGLDEIVTGTVDNLATSKWVIFPDFKLVKDTVPASYQDTNGVVYGSKKPNTILTPSDGNLATFGGYAYIGGSTLKGYNFYNNRDLNTPQSSKLYAFRGGTTSIFSQPSRSYTVKFTLAVELSPTVTFDVYVGSLSFSTYTLYSDSYKYTENRGTEQYEDYYAKVYTVTTVYNTTTDSISTLDGRQLWIKKTNNNGILRLLKCEITYKVIEYNLEFNNLLYDGINTDLNAVDFPTYSVVLSAPSGNGKEVGVNFGNGVFKKGIWENGVWNNGYRSGSQDDGWNQFGQKPDDVVKAFDILYKETYKISSKTWRVTLSISSNNLGVLSPKKKVSVGNIVGIDTNNKRVFFRDPIDIISIDSFSNKMVIKIVTNLDLREIVKDSSDHLIYITQNIWLNGVFLNGYFRGIWNNGVFKGFPRLTEMGESHWIDGTFDGGHFMSYQSYDDENRIFYNSGLIQNMTLFSNNVGDIGKFSYQSWIETTYSTQSFVNVNLDSTDYYRDLTTTDSDAVRYRSNLKGYPMVDVLSSVSYFRDVSTNKIQKYNFGSKKTRGLNKIPNKGNFVNVFSNAISKVGLSQFIRDGWTYSFFNGAFGGTPNRNIILESNTNQGDGKILRIFATPSNPSGPNSYDYTTLIMTLNNTNIVTTKNRYYEIEVNLNSPLPGTNSGLLFNAAPFNGDDFYDHTKSNSLTKTEYFYNKTNLNMLLYVGEYDAGGIKYSRFDNISFYEVDMIPFFQYATQSGIDLSVRAQFVGVAPVIDFTNKNFDFIENVDLGIDYRTVNIQNNVTANATIKGTSVPIEYQIQASGEIVETDFASSGVGGQA
jgi:hypothetical protein